MSHRLFCPTAAAFLILGLMAGAAAASIPETSALGPQAAPSAGLLNSGLVDLSRLELSHSLSYGFSSSSGYGDRSGGLWLTRASYRISNPLKLAVDVGAVLDPTGGGPIMDENSFFLRGVELNYQPSKNFQLNVSYQNLPAKVQSVLPFGGYGYRPWGSPLGLDR